MYQVWSIDSGSLNLTFHSAFLTPQPSITFELTIAPKHCNYLGNLHGGCAATLFDVLSTMILLGVSKPGFFELGGVSRHLSVTYLRPVPMGTRVRLVSKVVNMGKRLALMRSEIVRVYDDGREEVCVVSDHDKANKGLQQAYTQHQSAQTQPCPTFLTFNQAARLLNHSYCFSAVHSLILDTISLEHMQDQTAQSKTAQLSNVTQTRTRLAEHSQAWCGEATLLQ